MPCTVRSVRSSMRLADTSRHYHGGWLSGMPHPTSRRDADLHRVDEPLEVRPTVYLDIVRSRDVEGSGSGRDDDGLPARHRPGTEQMSKVMLAADQVFPVLGRIVPVE